MPVRDIEELYRWIERESPSAAARRVARHFLAQIGDEAWRSPSGQRPVRIWYRHIYATDAVDVIAVTNR